MKRTLLKRAPLNRVGPKQTIWKEFRNEKAQRDRDEEGILHCEDWKIGMSKCGLGLPELDLHHIEGREGKLFLDESKMVWLTRNCHERAHQS